MNGVVGVILAAGGGSRLGGGKLLLPWKGRPLVAHVVETASRCNGLCALVAVLGHDADRVRRAIGSDPPGARHVNFVDNPNWEEGQSTSLILGVEAAVGIAGGAGPGGVMILLGDQPLIRSGTLDILVKAHLKALECNPNHAATAPQYDGKRGNPVILSPALFAAVRRLRGDVGARGILASHAGDVLLVPVDDPGVVHDVDTPEAYARLDVQGQAGKPPPACP